MMHWLVFSQRDDEANLSSIHRIALLHCQLHFSILPFALSVANFIVERLVAPALPLSFVSDHSIDMNISYVMSRVWLFCINFYRRAYRLLFKVRHALSGYQLDTPMIIAVMNRRRRQRTDLLKERQRSQFCRGRRRSSTGCEMLGRSCWTNVNAIWLKRRRMR